MAIFVVVLMPLPNAFGGDFTTPGTQVPDAGRRAACFLSHGALAKIPVDAVKKSVSIHVLQP
jgi:hypothetical protein